MVGSDEGRGIDGGVVGGNKKWWRMRGGGRC